MHYALAIIISFVLSQCNVDMHRLRILGGKVTEVLLVMLTLVIIFCFDDGIIECDGTWDGG